MVSQTRVAVEVKIPPDPLLSPTHTGFVEAPYSSTRVVVSPWAHDGFRQIQMDAPL